MEEQDEKPPEPPKACAQDSFLPQEIIIKAEGEDTGSLTIPSQVGWARPLLYTEKRAWLRSE
ncbi:hypothetical protein H8959_005270 [Pygathrix nigripes]